MDAKNGQIFNRTIFTRDNIEVLRGMDDESVDLIYLDPPFNSNRHYSAPTGGKAAGASFKDAWTLDDVDVAWVNQMRTHHPIIATLIEAVGMSRGGGATNPT